MKKLAILLLMVTGCATVPTKNRCTLVMRVDSEKCYDVCLTYSRLSEKPLADGMNNTFLSCLNDVCGAANVCLELDPNSPQVLPLN